MDTTESVDRDVIALARDAGDATAVVMQIREGVLIGRQDLQLAVDKSQSESDILSGFLSQYYNYAENLPSEVFLQFEFDDSEIIETWLSEQKKSRVHLRFPQRGEKLKLVALAEKNARLLLDELLLQKKKYSERVPAASAELQKILRLERAPLTVSCFDVSNLGSTDKAASLVYFEKGKPKKSGYRHFKIKTVEGQDDFASMREVVTRYVKRCDEESKPLPDLMMVDGGKGQLGIAHQVLTQQGHGTQPIIGLAKRLEEVHVIGQRDPISIPRTSPALNLLKKVRDEAHRFAIEYHRKLRTKRTIASDLDAIPGIGENRKTILLKTLGSLSRVKTATVEELAAVPGIPKKLAQKIYDHFRTEIQSA